MERRFDFSLRQVAGFYVPKENISLFYDSGTTPVFKYMKQLSDKLATTRAELVRTRQAGSGEFIRFAKTVELLIDIERESEDVSTVSHEAVHQLAANTNLFPRDGPLIRWVHEGLASFFESAKLANWNGVGVVDENRIGYYRILEGDPIRGSLEFIVSDKGFVLESMLGDQLPAYGQAWALTHFLFNNRFDQTIQFYRKIQKADFEEVDSVETLNTKGEKLLAIFDETFGDRVALELEWRRYMRTLKTDREQMVEELRK